MYNSSQAPHIAKGVLKAKWTCHATRLKCIFILDNGLDAITPVKSISNLRILFC